jgi:hypothetical protein
MPEGGGTGSLIDHEAINRDQLLQNWKKRSTLPEKPQQYEPRSVPTQSSRWQQNERHQIESIIKEDQGFSMKARN